jgi:PAS domain S-box-containing protein
MTADSEGNNTAVTGEVITILGYASNELVGRSIETIIPDKYRADHRAGMSRYQSAGTKKVMGSWLNVQALHKDGNEIEVTFCVTERQGVLEAILETPAAAQFGFLGKGSRGGIA